ncbi:hypothetical protein ACHAWF_004108, partial [Thalassiosira exigua]
MRDDDEEADGGGGGGWRELDDEEAIRFATRSMEGASVQNGGARDKAGRTLFAAAVVRDKKRRERAAVVGEGVAVPEGVVVEVAREEVVPAFEVAVEAEEGAGFHPSTTPSDFPAPSVDEAASSWAPDEISEVMELFREDIGEWAVEAPSCPTPRAAKAPKCSVESAIPPASFAAVPEDKTVVPAAPPKKDPRATSERRSGVSRSRSKRSFGAKFSGRATGRRDVVSASPPAVPPESAASKKNSHAATSRHNGVSKSRSRRLFEAKFSKHALGSYVLESDAALAYDGFLRRTGWVAEHGAKINFVTREAYLRARERELRDREGERTTNGEDAVREAAEDLERTLAEVTSRVDRAGRA